MSARRLLAAVAALAVTAGCTTDPGTSGAVATQPIDAIASLEISDGGTAVIGMTAIPLADGEQPITVVRLTAAGDAADPRVATVTAVQMYTPAQSGWLGAVHEANLSTTPFQLYDAAGTVVDNTKPEDWGVAVLVTGTGKGAWRADYLDITYTQDGKEHTQRVHGAAAVCVEQPGCDPGLPPWMS